MTPHPPHIQTLLDLAANTPLQVDFAFEDSAEVEQMVQSFQAIADHCAEHLPEFNSLGQVVAHLFFYKSEQATVKRLHYFGGKEKTEDPRPALYKALFSLYRMHHNRISQLAADPAQR